MQPDDPINIPIHADFTLFRAELTEADKLARGFGRALDNAFVGGIVKGRSFGDVLRTLGLQLSSMVLRSALQPITSGLGEMFGNLFGGGGGATPFAKGGLASGGIVPFAEGGIVRTPTLFPMGARTGLMGEAGAEAIMPLARGADGRLGVRAQGGGGGGATVHVHIATRDAESFRRSESEITAALARAVARGQRGM